jgi:hypothetical protein
MKTRLPHTRTILLSIFCLTLLIFSAKAQQAKKISLQGFLKDADGKAVPNGRQDITFKLYPTATGGAAEWSETQSINVFGGVYSTHLGLNTNAISGGVSNFEELSWGSKTYFVGVTLQDAELTPRTELTFAPYSLGAPFAQKSQEVICSGAVGDVKYSILNPTQFAAVNGNCWVPMDGRSMTGSKLATITGLSTVTNAGGLFLRGQEFNNSPNNDPDRTPTSVIATFQDQAFANHNHYANLSLSGGSTTSNGSHTHSVFVPGRSEEGGFIAQGNSFVSFSATDRTVQFYPNLYSGSAGDHSHSLSGNATGNTEYKGDNETRPKNLNLWTYIRIN